MSYVAGPLAALVLIPGLALTAFGLGSGRGWGVPSMVPGAVAFYLVLALWGALFGAAFGLIGGLGRRARPGTTAAAWWATANRPIRLPGRRTGPAALDEIPTPPSRRLWPWLVGVPGLIALVVLAAAFAAGVSLGRAVDHRLAAAVAAADRDDPAWRLDDLMARRDPVPDGENSALVVVEALARLPADWPTGPPPPPGMSRPPNEVMDALDALGKTPDNVQLDDATAAMLRGELESHPDAVALARTVADYRRGRHEIALGPALIDTPLGETQAARNAARLLTADAAIRARDVDPDGALESCRAILGVSRSIGDEPFLISMLVRIAIGRVAMNSARRALGQCEPSDEALARLQALLLDEMHQPLLLQGVKGERTSMFEMIRRVGSGEVPIDALSGGWQPDGTRHAIAPWGKLMFDNQRAVALEWMNAAVAAARRVVAEQPALWRAWEDEVERVKHLWRAKYSATLPVLLTPSMDLAWKAHAEYQAQLGATAVLLAAERHRRKIGDWPVSVAAIDRAILPDPPTDPYTGQPYHVGRREGKVCIYSIGLNRRDDRGVFDRKRWAKGGPDDMGATGWDVRLRRQPPAAEGE
ncbi:MAG TPA: hypothetical protein VG406_09530 [Isosphaeraceae bacterium]|nr:hypothetical protein [Isosphaeraceae bacterium]